MVRTDRHLNSAPASESITPLVLAVFALAGMAYCHIEDVGMKFDEHVYYMAGLFCCNIAASLALIPALIVAELKGADSLRRAVWAGAAALALATILGFLWSRTVGFPQMEDHIGQWDRLGIASLIFEMLLLTVSVAMLRRRPRVWSHAAR
jgi:uncharacterized membrane protein (GlpM family)